ncbi:MAG: hypothetical protein MOB07_18365 [Acidobacteria bacterium]|nr:hypothetical protein [Acidobacteriota bacterium]
MYCPNCAAPIDGAKFCRSCGQNVSLIPQAMTGELPKSDGARDERNWGHHHWGGHHWDHHHGKKEPSIEKAATSFFSGIGFLLAAIFVALFSSPGVWWGWVFLFPAFSLIGAGIGQYLQLKEKQRQQPSLNQPGAQQVAHQPPGQAPTLAAPTTSELVKPSSVTEHTTKHLESGRAREEKNDQ